MWFCVLIFNVALYKPTYMHYPLIPGNDTYEASNAVDGRKSDLSADGGQCAISNLTNTSTTLWVNLTSIYSIHHITSYFTMGSVTGTISPSDINVKNYSYWYGNNCWDFDYNRIKLCIQSYECLLNVLESYLSLTFQLHIVLLNDTVSHVFYVCWEIIIWTFFLFLVLV